MPPQTKTPVLGGWSTLTGAKGGTPLAGPKKAASTSETFAEFRKAAKEKADRERGLKEQQVQQSSSSSSPAYTPPPLFNTLKDLLLTLLLVLHHTSPFPVSPLI